MSTTTTRRPAEPLTVVSVTDTRDYIEQGDRMVPVAGTGNIRSCDRCDRTHEVHAHVTDATGETFTVGTGCVDATAPAVARRLNGQATRTARKAAEAAAREAAAVLVRDLAALAVSVPFPAGRVAHTVTARPAGGPDRHVWTVDGVKVLGTAGHDTAERMACLERVWREALVVLAVGGPVELGQLTRRANLTVDAAIYQAR